MQLYPQDLRERYHWEIVVVRANYGAGAPAETRALIAAQPQTKKPVGRLGGLWLSKLPLTRQQAEMALPAAAMSTQGVAWLSQTLLTGLGGLMGAVLYKKGILTSPEAWGMIAAAGGAIFYPSFVLWPRAVLKRLYNKPLQSNEIDGLVVSAKTDLERDYLTLIRDAIAQPVPKAAEADVRAAIQALGQAVDALPSVELAPVDTQALRNEAASLRGQAEREQDRIIADSRENRADALERHANAADRSVLYARRITALQEEISAQIAATRQDLATFRADGNGAGVNSASFAHLADAGKRIANVAVSAASARAELDGVLSLPILTELTEVTEDWQPSSAAKEQTAQSIQVTIK